MGNSAAQGLSAQGLLTLEEAVRIGLEKNPDISIARIESKILDNNVNLGKAGFLPRIDLAGTQGRTITDTKNRDFSGTVSETNDFQTDGVTADATLNWTLFDGWNMFINFSKQRASRDIGRLELKSHIENAVAGIINAYCEIQKQSHLFRVLSEAVAISRERLRLAENNLRLGSGSRFDVLRAKVDLNADESARFNQETAVKNARIELIRILGIEMDADFSVQDSVTIGSKMEFPALKEALINRNTSLLMEQKNGKLANLNVKGTTSRWYPKLGLNSSSSFDRNRYKTGETSLSETRGYYLGATVSFNLFNGFSDWVDLQNAKSALRIQELELENLKRELAAALESEYNSYVQAMDLLVLESDNLAIAKQTLDIARERFKLGSYTPLEMREAQKAYIEAESRLVSARYTVKTSENELKRLTGQFVKEKPE